LVNKIDCFALKGGTALNFFVLDAPRISVDIDLVYVLLKKRDESLTEISESLKMLKSHIAKQFHNSIISEKVISGGYWISLFISYQDIMVKVQVNTILRGVVYPVIEMKVNPKALVNLKSEHFCKIQVLDMAELYGGKIVAALDRQHPRDLFDVKILFEQGGITEKVKTAFIVYLSGHNRPIHEMLKPKCKDLEPAFSSEFSGMTSIPVSINDLLDSRQQLFDMIPGILSDNEKKFLISLKNGEPEWSLLPVTNIEKFPSIQWKLHNIKKLEKKKHLEQLKKLEKVLK
jgi:predicted nucleotidyltransferase component of viral defense system